MPAKALTLLAPRVSRSTFTVLPSDSLTCSLELFSSAKSAISCTKPNTSTLQVARGAQQGAVDRRRHVER
jgi:hypothetical protein